MTTEEILIVIGVALLVVILIAVAVWIASSRRRARRERLRERYGREYDDTVQRRGERAAVDDLDAREREREGVELRRPDDATRAHVRERMASLQFRFVEDPAEVLLETQRVVVDGLRACGYPIAGDRDRALRVLSVDYPEHTPPLRALLQNRYGDDVDRMRELFLDARRALLHILHVSYSQQDLGAATRAPGETSGAQARAAQVDDGAPGDGTREPPRSESRTNDGPGDGTREQRTSAQGPALPPAPPETGDHPTARPDADQPESQPASGAVRRDHAVAPPPPDRS